MSGCFDNNSGIVLVANAVNCAKGYYCPNVQSGDASTSPTFCNPSAECAVTRLLGAYCVDSAKPNKYFGAQGLFEPGTRC